jgi:hypothetical protein
MNEVTRHEIQAMVMVGLWTPAIWTVFGAVKLILFLMGQIIVPISLFWNPRGFWLWDNDEPGFQRKDFPTKWGLYVDRAWRNASGNTKYVLGAAFGDPKKFIQRDNFMKHPTRHADPMEGPGLKWRYRQIKFLSSFRVTWGAARRKGKKEFYGGFKIGSNVPGLGFTLQLRAGK